MIPGKIPATPPPANREFLERGDGSRCWGKGQGHATVTMGASPAAG